jgi:hypothetical protein
MARPGGIAGPEQVSSDRRLQVGVGHNATDATQSFGAESLFDRSLNIASRPSVVPKSGGMQNAASARDRPKTHQVSIRRALGERLLSSIHTFFALRDYFPVLSFVVLPRTLAGFRLFR